MEAERPTAVVERLLEKKLDGEFTIDTSDGPRTVALRGKADRLDLLADGSITLTTVCLLARHVPARRCAGAADPVDQAGNP